MAKPKKKVVMKKATKKRTKPDHTYKFLFLIGIILIGIILVALYMQKNVSLPSSNTGSSQNSMSGY